MSGSDDLNVTVIDTESLVTVARSRPSLLSEEGLVRVGKKEDRDIHVLVSSEAFGEIDRHTSTETEREVGGFLIGRPSEWQGQAYVEIVSALAGKTLSSSAVHVTISPDTWARAQAQVRQKSGKDCIVGWYHTHPNMPIFMSKQDLSIQRGFFRESWQVALVVEPNSREASFFVWSGREVKPAKSFQVSYDKDTPEDKRWRVASLERRLKSLWRGESAVGRSRTWWHNRWVRGDSLSLRMFPRAKARLDECLATEARPILGLCRGLQVWQRLGGKFDHMILDIHAIDFPLQRRLKADMTEPEVEESKSAITRAIEKEDYLAVVGWFWMAEAGRSHPLFDSIQKERPWPELRVLLRRSKKDATAWCWQSDEGGFLKGELVEVVQLSALSGSRCVEALKRVRRAFVEAQIE